MRVAAIAVPLALALVSIPAAAGILVEPNPVRIDATFRGVTVRVSGEALPGARVFVSVTGAAGEEKFHRKGRVGPIWATVETVVVTGAPRLHLVADGAPEGALSDRRGEGTDPFDPEDALRGATFAASGADRPFLVREFLALKRSSGDYGRFQGAVRFRPGDPPSFEAEIPWPGSATPGDYSVEVLQMEGMRVVRRETVQLRVEFAGLPRFLADMAFRWGTVYGVMSVVGAVGIGFVMGLVFKRAGR